MTEEASKAEINGYELSLTLGNGTYSKVKLGENEKGEKVAIKIIKKQQYEIKPDMVVKLKREIALMKLLNHPHILKLIDVCEGQRHLYIILEYASNGELYDYLVENGALEVELAFKFFRQIVYGIEYLHSYAICHRDLKPENILLDAHNSIKIADFGFARWMKHNVAVTACGSPHYAAPEIITGLPYDGRIADIWSLGIILYTLLVGRLPFDERTVRKLLVKVKSGKFVMPNLHPDIQDLLSKILTVDPKQRITLEQIKVHPAFRIGMVPMYKCPSPIPLPKNLPTFKFEDLSKEVVSILENLGYETEEKIKEELTSEENTICKAFCYMVHKVISFDEIKWEGGADEETDDIEEDNQLMIDSEPVVASSLKLQPQLVKRENNDINSSMSVTMYSVVDKGMFGDFNANWGTTEDSKEIIINNMEPERLMKEIQDKLTELSVLWAYPDDFTFYIRVPGSADIICFCSLLSKDCVRLDVRLYSGNPDKFEEICNELRSISPLLSEND